MTSSSGSELIGRRLGDFEVLERIGCGGMGTVYKARQLGMDRIVALKVLPPQLACSPTALKRFYQEARAAARLDHPNIVRAIAVGEQDGLHYFGMEYVEGESLAQRIGRCGPLDEQEAVRIVVAVADALQAAHDLGMVHRDVKPENVLLLTDGRVKLADLGLVKRRDRDLGLTQAGRGLGTLNYMAPEQFRDAKHADARCDIYALGLTLYSALTGQMPWFGLGLKQMFRCKCRGELADVRQLNPAVSAATSEAVRRATDPNPRRRFQTCRQFADQLRGHSPPPAPAASVDQAQTRLEVDLGRQLAPERSDQQMPADLWFVRFTDPSGRRKQLKLRTHEVRHGIQCGRLTETMRLARSPSGPWLHVSAFEEFRDLVAHLSHGQRQAEVEADLHRTVEALRSGRPLRPPVWPARRLIGLAIAVLAVAATVALIWLSSR